MAQYLYAFESGEIHTENMFGWRCIASFEEVEKLRRLIGGVRIKSDERSVSTCIHAKDIKRSTRYRAWLVPVGTIERADCTQLSCVLLI